MLALSRLVRARFALACAVGLAAAAYGAFAEEHDHGAHDHQHGDHQHPPDSVVPKETPKAKAAAGKDEKKKHAHDHARSKHAKHRPAKAGHAGHGGHSGPAQRHGGMHGGIHDGGHGGMAMKGFLGPYPMTREGSGTSWVPEATPHEGVHAAFGDWTVMWHALINGVYGREGGPRGDQKTFVSGMVMGMAQRQVGDNGTLGLRAMLSPDPLMGPRGYPLLFAAGETADGRTLLVDRQHPHDLFMELAATYSYSFSANSSLFIYAGLPGEPALGPTAFMHRISGMDNPEAPISHHWLDSTHITFGVVTVGAVVDTWKIEASAFRGREPDQHRWDIEAPRLDSFSARLTWNPVKELSAQVSWGRIRSPEQLEPGVDEDRITASATYTQPFGDNNLWSSTFAWGRKMLRPGETHDAFLLESALILQRRYTLFMRAERIDAHDLLSDMPGIDEAMAHASFPVTKFSAGGIYDVPVADHVRFGVGGLVSKFSVPAPLTPFYGSDPTSYKVFVRLKVS